MVEVSLDFPLSDQIPKDLSEATPKVHFSGSSFTLNFWRRANASPKCFAWLERSRLHEHVNNIHLHCIPDSLLEDFVDHPLESGSDILQAEGHDFVTVDGTTSDEGYLVLI